MAAKQVRFTLNQTVPIGYVDVKFQIYDGPSLLGTLTLSQGSIDWRPARQWQRSTIKKRWGDFDQLMKASVK